jgi:hypothetical protein
MQEVEDEKREWEARRLRSGCGSDAEEDDDTGDQLQTQSPQDMDQTICPWDVDDELDADGDVYVELDD